MENYTKQANDFLAKTNTTMTAQYLGHFPRFDEWPTSQWQVTFTRQGRKPFSLVFSQSLNESWTYQDANATNAWRKNNGLPPKLSQSNWPKTSEAYKVGPYTITPAKRPPSAYDVMACLTKYDPGTFNEFCDEYGYNNDSIKALDTYRAVQEEWSGVRRMFGGCLEELEEIN